MRKSRTLLWVTASCFVVSLAATLIFLLPAQGPISGRGTRSERVIARTNFRPSDARATSAKAVAEHFEGLPLAFQPSPAQPDNESKFVARGIGYTLFLAPTEAVLALRGRTAPAGVLRLQFVGAEGSPRLYASDELPGKSNYLIGSSPEGWRTSVPNYAKVTERGVYPGIDLVYYGNQHQLEYDFVVNPGADPSAIRLALQGSERVRIDRGELVMAVAAGNELRMHEPVAYQESRGTKQPIAANYVIDAKGEVAFQVAQYDRARPLIVDPTLAYSTYLGGSNIDGANGIAVAPDNTAFITGGTFSFDFPTAHALQPNHGGPDDFDRDAFVAKISADGSQLLYSTYLGGKNQDVGNGIAVDTFGDAYVTGTTLSPDFPTTPGSFNTLCGGDGKCGASLNPGGLLVSNAFVSKLNPAGSGLIYSGFLGEYENVLGLAIAVDNNESAYVTGQTEANGVPTVLIIPPNVPPPPFPITGTPALPGTTAFQTVYGGGATDAYVTKISADGTTYLYSTYAGGTNEDGGYGIAVDSNGDGVAYATGLTYSTNFPTAGAIPQAVAGGAGDAFALKINTDVAGPAGLIYSTYLGGSNLDQGYGVAVDAAGNAYVAGETESNSFAFTPNGFQTANNGEGDAFVAMLTPTGALSYFTFLGGTKADYAAGIAIGNCANPAYPNLQCAFITGSTVSTDFPITKPVFQPAYGGGNADAFVAELSPTGAALIYSSFLGGTNTEIAGGIGVDTNGSAYVAGQTCSLDFPLSNPLQVASGGNCDAYITKVSVLGGLAINPAGLVFPAQSQGTPSGSQTLTLTNTNDTASITISSIALAPSGNPGDFSQTNTCSGVVLQAGTQCTITVTFTPQGPGLRKASLTVTDNAPGSPQLVSLNGSTSTVLLSASSLLFGTQQVGTASNPQTITVTNVGTSALNFASITASGDFAQINTCSVPLQQSTTCSIIVDYQPLSAGKSVGAITLTDNGSGSPQIILLNGTGFVQNPDFAISAVSPAGAAPAGQAVSYTLMVSSLAGFSQPIQLNCTGLPRGATFGFSTNPVTAGGTVASQVTLTVFTALRTAVPPISQRIDPFTTVRQFGLPWLVSLLALSILAITATVRRRGLGALGLALTLAMFAAACGTSAGVPAGTPAGTYPITVTGSSGSLTHATTLTLNVE